MTTSLTRWSPYPDLLRGRLGRLFDQAFTDFLAPLAGGEEIRLGPWSPAVDIRETPEALIFQVELPGMDKDDIEITLENRVLSLRGEREFSRDDTKETYHRVERAYGQFTRSFGLPTDIATDEVKAAFAEGVLTIELPKAETAKSRRVAIA